MGEYELKMKGLKEEKMRGKLGMSVYVGNKNSSDTFHRTGTEYIHVFVYTMNVFRCTAT